MRVSTFIAALMGSLLIGCQGETVTSAPADASTDALATPDTPLSDAWSADALTTSPGCGTFPGPKMVRIEASKPYCIDTTEVTNGQYAQFLASPKPPLPKWCPKGEMDWPAPVYNVNLQNRPRGDVAWCDAWAYCAWAGKRLCGAIAGGRTSHDEYLIPELSQWSWACGNGAAHDKYPYGGTTEKVDACVNKATDPVDVASLDTCRGTKPPFDQIYDMVGNAGEWEDSCSGYEGTNPTTRTCHSRGGWTGNTLNNCSYELDQGADNRALDLSFRCCKDL